MLALCYGLVLIPAGILLIWFTTPLFKDIMIATTEGWGAVVGLGGFALLIANMMPIIVPTMCFAAIIAGIIGIARRGSNV